MNKVDVTPEVECLLLQLRAAVSLERPLLHSDVDEIERALTGRQTTRASLPTVGEEPLGHIDPADMARVEFYRKDQGVCAVRVHLRITGEDMPEGSVPVYTAPPAQDIDLGEFSEPVHYWLHAVAGYANAARAFGPETRAAYASKVAKAKRLLSLIGDQS